MPGLQALPVSTQVIFWAVIGVNAVLTALAGWFLKRYIDQKDKRDDKVIDKLTTHDTRAVEHAIKIESVATQIKQTSLDFHKSQVDFQSRIHNEFDGLRKDTVVARGYIHEAKVAAQSVAERLTETRKEMQALYDMVQTHNRQLSMGASTLARHNEELKAVLKKMNLETPAVTEKKTPGKG